MDIAIVLVGAFVLCTIAALVPAWIASRADAAKSLRNTHESYSVRDRVSNGELTAETSAWYDGADGWVPLAEVPSMVSAFTKSDGDATVVADFNEEFIEQVKVSPAEETHELPKLHMGRRFSFYCK